MPSLKPSESKDGAIQIGATAGGSESDKAEERRVVEGVRQSRGNSGHTHTHRQMPIDKLQFK